MLLSEPDPRWAGEGEAQVRAVATVLGTRALLVEHVGSTSIPGLVAKPILDLVVEVPDPRDEQSYAPALVDLGYRLVHREPGWHDHRLLKRSEPSVNLHVFGAGSPETVRMIVFRDTLRADRAELDRYGAAKRALAARTWEYVQDYADAKSDVVEAILRRAGAPPR